MNTQLAPVRPAANWPALDLEKAGHPEAHETAGQVLAEQAKALVQEIGRAHV